MATTTTYSFTTPTVGGNTGTWGGLLNANWDKVDDLLDGTTAVTGINITSGTATFSVLTATSGWLDGLLITGASVAATDLTVSGKIVEGNDTVTGATPTITPDSGTLIRWTLTASTAHTPTITLDNGESAALLITSATSATITWPAGMLWFNGAPTLEDSVLNMVEIFKDSGVLYGVYVGSIS